MPRAARPTSLALALLAWGTATLVGPATVRAQDRLTLTARAPDACPDATAMRAEVARLLGGAIPDGPPVEAEASTEAMADGFRLTLRTRTGDAEGERTLEGPACEGLADAAALVLALMIDPARVVDDEPAPEATTRPTPDPAPRAAASLAGPDAPAPPSWRAPRRAPQASPAEDPAAPPSPGFVGAGAGVDVGTVPAPSAWVWVEAGWGVPLVDGRLRAGVVTPQPGLRAAGSSAGADITSVSVDARACVHPFEAARGLAACGGLLLGVSVAQGFGLASTETGLGTFFGAVVGIEARWRPVDAVGLGLDATLVIPFNPLEFAVRAAGGDEVFLRQEPVSGRFGAGVSVHF